MKSAECGNSGKWAGLRLVFFVNCAICLGLLALSLAISPRWTLANFGQQFLGNWVYSNCIGFLAAIVVPRVAIRISGYPPVKRWTIYVTVLVAIGATGAMIANLILILPGIVPPDRFMDYYRASARVAILITVVIGIGSYVIEDLRHRAEQSTLELRERQLDHERALKLATEARLSSLESRLKPHFLFNTINSIQSLIREDPRSAEEMLERLSRLLRFSLDTQERGLVALSEELRLVEDYLAIERTRFGARLRFSVDAPDDLRSVAIPPYSLQTLVENSMKYAVAPRREGGEIRVRVARSDSGIDLEVRDDGPGFTHDQIASGHGLDTLVQRLETLYGDKGRLAIENGQGALVRLTVPESAAA